MNSNDDVCRCCDCKRPMELPSTMRFVKTRCDVCSGKKLGAGVIGREPTVIAMSALATSGRIVVNRLG